MRADTSILKLAARRVEANPKLLFSLGELWCHLMHDEITWPSHGHYRCHRCHRLYPVPWKEPVTGQGLQAVEIPGLQPQIAALQRTAASRIKKGGLFRMK